MTPQRPPALRDLLEILWLPLIVGAITAAVTWLIWYYTSAPCSSQAAVLHHCNPAPIARYVNAEIWTLCLTLGALIGGIVGGGVNYAMFSRERAARIAAETMAAEQRKLREEERRQWEDERRVREEERVAERQRVDQLVAQVAESQRQVVATQQAMLSVITELTAELAELRRQRNGGNGRQ